MKFKAYFITTILGILLFSGCYKEAKKPTIVIKQHNINRSSNVLKLSKILVDNLFINKEVRELCCCNSMFYTTFVNLDNFNSSSSFGRLLSESVAHNIRKLDIDLIDIRVGKSLLIEPKNGEFILSREARELYEKYRAQYIILGTYSIFDGKVAVHLKIVDINSNIVVASSEAVLTRVPDSLELEGSKDAIKIQLL
jgi:TolB-like protein